MICLALPAAAVAQTDEIQVYDGDIANAHIQPHAA